MTKEYYHAASLVFRALILIGGKKVSMADIAIFLKGIAGEFSKFKNLTKALEHAEREYQRLWSEEAKQDFMLGVSKLEKHNEKVEELNLRTCL